MSEQDNRQIFKEKLSGTYVNAEEYLNRTSYAIGSIVQILENIEIDATNRKAIYDEISNISKGVGYHCRINYHQKYREWCKK